MRRRARAILAAASLLTAGLVAAPVAQASQSGADGEGIVVWNAQVSRAQLPLLLEAGADAQELGAELPAKGSAGVELYLTKSQAAALRGKGVTLSERKVSAQSQNRLKAAGDGVFRPYSGTNGLKQEILDTGRANPGLTKVESIGRTTNGQDILALKLTKGANKSKDGSKPATLYMSNQHAREWITPEMTRRLMHYYLDNYGKDPRITKIVDSTELWFVDDTRLVVGGTASGAEGFETSLGPWSVPGAPAGSPGNSGDWARSQALFHSSAAVATRDTVLLGFGLENVPSAADRKQVLGKALSALHR
ncbi:hypothetical protein SXANM310S_05377 [Streptomyces xanthochromogenes]